MSETPTDTMPEQAGAVPNTDPYPDPFSGNSTRLAVTQPVDASQLQDELEKRTRTPQVMVAVQAEPGKEISKSNPGMMFVSPKNISERVIVDVLANHVPKPPVPLAETPTTPAPQPPSGFDPSTLPEDQQALVEKLKDGDTLKTSELSDLLRGILGI